MSILKKYLLFLPGLVLATISCTSREKIKRDQYFIRGEELYGAYCANCHQPGGEGMANLYPPLHFPAGKERFIQIVKHGMDGEIEVNGQVFNRPMPANPGLTDLDIAELATFIYNKWGEEDVYTPIDSVKKALGKFSRGEDLRRKP